MYRNKKVAGGYNYDDDEDYVPTKKVKYSESECLPKTKKHTLDSDEEDDDTGCVDEDDDDVGQQESNMLQNQEIDGQEEETIDHEGETTITPFNMKEEMEDGHFDRDGYYHFKKDNDIKDAWLDDIDWVKVKRDGDIKKYGSDVESDNETELLSEEKNNIIEIYKEILSLLKPEETVAKALKRLGGNSKKLTSAQKWKMKKSGLLSDDTDNKKNLLKLSELSNKLVEEGNMDVYQETYEMINLKIERTNQAPKSSFDMFSDGDGAEESTDKESKNEQPSEIEEVKWRFKWKNEEEEKIHGPFSSQEMLKWQTSGYFKNGVYVQKMSETSGDWYTSKRIDFDLYV